jgi:hypothetical protein
MYPDLLKASLEPRASDLDAPILVCLRLVLMNPFLTTRETKTPYLSTFLDELLAVTREIV